MKFMNNSYSLFGKAILLVAAMATSLFFTSCEDDDKDNLNDFLTTGGFVRFVNENPPSAVGVTEISDLSYSFAVEDANGNAASYDLKLYANIGGSRTDTVAVALVTEFPASFSFDADELAGLLNITANDIGFGDNFFFSAEVTTVDGEVYFAYDRLDYDDADDENPSTYTLSGGGLTDDLIDEPGYRQAFEFDFIILCPSVDLGALTGTYNVENHAFDAFFGPQGDTRTVIEGPGENQITILGGAIPLDGADDLILTINTTNSRVSYGGEADAIHFNTFGPATYGSVEGLVFSCIGRIDIQIDSEGFIPNFLTLQK